MSDPEPGREIAEVPPAPAAGPRMPVRFGLSVKLLLLTIAFVMIAEVLIYVPSIANFRSNWIADRLQSARTAALVLDISEKGRVDDARRRQVLDSIGALAVAIKMGDTRRLLADLNHTPTIARTFDARIGGATRAIMEAFETLLCGQGRIVRVIGVAPMGGDFMEIVFDETTLRDAMLRFSRNILLLSLLISGMTALFVYLALSWLIVGPIRRLSREMVAFKADPQNTARILVPGERGDEIGIAEREFAAMQQQLSEQLNQQSHLAALGLAVSKINHDLRNLLASAQLLSDRLSSVRDPTVQRVAPKLLQALDRAISFCQSTLSYGAAREPPPDRRPVAFAPIVREVAESMGLEPVATIGWIVAIENDLAVDADPDHLFRVLLNLTRNAVQAFENRGAVDADRDQIRLTARREGSVVVIEIADTGPGIPERARADLFKAFGRSTKSGGTGLGLAIAAELIRGHGGTIQLVEGTIGATFRITIPDRAIDLQAARSNRRAG